MDYTDWRVHHSISISPSTPEADWKIRITLNSANFDYSFCNFDGSDLRFSDTSYNSLNYWIEKWNPVGDSYIWVKIPTSSTSTIYMWSKNKSATSESSISTTLDSFSIGSLSSYTTGYSSFFVFKEDGSTFIIGVKENGTLYSISTTSKYTWTLLSRSNIWDNPAGPSWSYSESGWNDYDIGPWNYSAQGDNSGAYTHVMQFIGNGRSGSTNYSSQYHHDYITIAGAYYLNGYESGGSLTGTAVLYASKGRSSETVTITKVNYYISGILNVAGVPAIGYTLRLYDRETGEFLEETTSTTGGAYQFSKAYKSGKHYVVALYTNADYDAIIKDKIEGGI